jgi:peptide-methionine (R)-S-oxide reductase
MASAYNPLTRLEEDIIERGATEYPFSGEYDGFFKEGTYICRRCNNPLYSSKTKFDAGCGWPAFDDHFPGSVNQLSGDKYLGYEIRCAHCDGHLGHVYFGEQFTEKNSRHCVNSLSIRFIPIDKPLPKILSK